MKLNDLKAEDQVFVDGGFTCMGAGFRSVYDNESGLYLKCSHGHHFLDGQEGENGELIGIYDSKEITQVTIYSAVSDQGDGSYLSKLFGTAEQAEDFEQHELDEYGQACMGAGEKHTLFFNKDGILLNPDKIED